MRKDDYTLLKSYLNDIDLPQYYFYKLDSRKKNLTLTLCEKGLKANMQDNESAFESWAIILKFYLSEQVETVTIDWVESSVIDETSLHFNRFVYRLSKFVQTYDWAFSAKSISRIPSILVCNCPNGEAADADQHKKGSESWIECKYVEKFCDYYDVMNHQFPVGIFYDKVSRGTYYTTGQKSAIDIWAIKQNEFFIFELKKPDNKPLGIISEIMFYTNIIYDLLSHRIQYQEDAKIKKAIKNNYRGFGDFYNAYVNGNIGQINAVLLAYNLHPLITQELLDFINDSSRLKFCHIKFSMQSVEL